MNEVAGRCSGMLPGFVAQYYTFDECHVDLARLASFAKAQFVHATATSIDPQARCFILQLIWARPMILLPITGDADCTALNKVGEQAPCSSFVETGELQNGMAKAVED